MKTLRSSLMNSVVHRCNHLLLRKAHLAYLLSSVASIYIATCGFVVDQARFGVRYFANDSARARPVVTTRPHEPLIVRHEKALVANIINTSMPSHPEKEKLASIIVDESRRANIDPLFVTAVIRAESMFKHKATSPRGAQGLMQLMPTTGRYISKLTNLEHPHASDLRDPVTNIRLGIAYLQYLEKKFQGNRERTLIAYNWGPSNLSKSLSGKGAPPTQSLKYARSILSHHDQWRTSIATPFSYDHDTVIG